MSYELDATYGCHLSTNRLTSDGYAYHGKTRAHLHAWVTANGSVPDGMFVDHLCRRRRCVNVLHLELVTKSENELRKSWRYRCRRMTCPRGHSMEHALVTQPEMGRVCRVCHLAQMRSVAQERSNVCAPNVGAQTNQDAPDASLCDRRRDGGGTPL